MQRQPAALDRQAIGRNAEDAAALFLQEQGFRLVLRNYRCRMGELDIVAERAGLLVIAEVRLRSREDFGGAAASVDFGKRRRIVRTARHLLQARPTLARLAARFDVLDVRNADGVYEVRWLAGAFDA